MPRCFYLYRLEDATGTSGTGIVAEGVQFSDLTVALRWLSETPSTVLYDAIASVEKVHGHAGKTVIRWLDAERKL